MSQHRTSLLGEDKLDTLIDRFSKKEEVVIDIDGTCNDEGTLEQILPYTIKLNPNVTHKVALMTLGTTSFFPNLTTDSNKFYYNNGTAAKTLTLARGAYEIQDYNNRIKKLIELKGDSPDNINITLDEATGKTDIELKASYKVYFSEGNVKTWKDCLGFEAIDLTTDGLHSSKYVADVLPVHMIYIGCNICKGSVSNRDKMLRSNTLFSFPNNKKFGSPIVLTPNPLRPREVLLKEFDTLRLQFVDDDGRPVNFMGAQVTGELYIYQS